MSANRLIVVVAALALYLALFATPAFGQRPPNTHAGAWFSGGGGGGWLEGNRGGAVYLRVGGTPHRKVLFGGEVLGWIRDESSQVNVTATALWYPAYVRTGQPGSDWFLKGGFGVAASEGDDTGLGLTFGTGYDFRLGSNFYVTPNVDVLVQFFEQTTLTGVLISLGLGFH
jgi:hypothetical protein